MNTWIKLFGVVALSAFLVCTLSGNKAFAAYSSKYVQSNQAAPSREASGGPANSAKASPSTKTPPPPHAPAPIPVPPPPHAPAPVPVPPPPPLRPSQQVTKQLTAPDHVIPPAGMTICTFTNSNGVVMAIVVPAGSTCHVHGDGHVTVTFPDGSSYEIPFNTVGGVFYTSNYDPVIIVPYNGSTVTAIPDYFPSGVYSVVFPDGRGYLLPMYAPGTIWFPFALPAPLPLQVPVKAPPGTWIFTFTNSNGDVIALVLPSGSACVLNPDGSVTVTFEDGDHYTIPANTSNGAFTTQNGWHIIAVPYYGSKITDQGPFGYHVTTSDGKDDYYFDWGRITYPPQGETSVPGGMNVSNPYRYWQYGFGAMPRHSPWLQVIGAPGTNISRNGNHTVITFPDGYSIDMYNPVFPGSYTQTVTVDPDGPFGPLPPHQVVYHYVIIFEGSTVTPLGNGWYHVQGPPGYDHDFDFQYP